MKVLLIGASRGIGFELARQYMAAGDSVTGTARDDAGLVALRGLGAHAIELDVAAEASAAQLEKGVGTDVFDRVVFCAGVYGPSAHRLEAPSEAEFDQVMHTNVLGAMRLLPLASAALAPGAALAVISSQMGSIGSRADSGGWLYRASKAALNSVLKDASLMLAGRAVCVALHPGWVRTAMGGAGATLSVEQSASDLRRLLDRLRPRDNGSFLNHDGSPIAW